MERLALFILLLSGCIPNGPQDPDTPTNLEQLPAFVRPGVIRAVIEIPAGTSEKREYDPATNSFPVKERNGVPRVIRFLPYPANYGFIPGTLMHSSQGGDGDALDVFVLCGALPTGTVLEVEPIGIIELLDDGERDDKLIALPVDPALRVMEAEELDELPAAVREILVAWLKHYDPEDEVQVIDVKGKQDALATVRKWTVRN